VDASRKDVTGTVRLKLYKGTVTWRGGRLAALALPDGFVTFEADPRLPAKGRRGFINLKCSSPQNPPPSGNGGR